jgi:hypothetical protein
MLLSLKNDFYIQHPTTCIPIKITDYYSTYILIKQLVINIKIFCGRNTYVSAELNDYVTLVMMKIMREQFGALSVLHELIIPMRVL